MQCREGDKWLRHCSFPLFISPFVTEIAVMSSFSGIYSAVSVQSQEESSLQSQVSGTGSHIDSGGKKGKWKTSPASPPSSPPSCQISIWSASWGSREAALYRRIRAWSVQISQIQWGMERGFCPLSLLTQIVTLSFFYGHRKKGNSQKICRNVDSNVTSPTVWTSVSAVNSNNIHFSCF